MADPEEYGRSRDRVLAFSDGVFAIAITLLVLSLKVPHLAGRHLDAQLRHALGQEGGTLTGFVISFYVIARYWMMHHRLSLRLRRVDARFITLNLVLLAFIVFLPFATEILGLYGSTTTAVVLYASTMVVVGVLSAALWEYAARADLTMHLSAEALRDQRRRSTVPIVVFAVSIPLAFLSPNVAKLWWVALIVSAALDFRRHRRRGRAPAHGSGASGRAVER